MLSDVYFPRVNGVSTSVQTLCRALIRLGHHITLVAPKYVVAPDHAPQAGAAPGRSDGSADGPELLRVPARRVPLDPEDRLMRGGDLRHLSRRLAGRPCDVLHVHTPFAAHYAGLRLARRLGVPAVETYHTLFEEYLQHYAPLLPAAWLRFAARRLSATQCNQVAGVVVPSTAMAARLRAYGVRRATHVIPTGLDAESFTPGDGMAFRARHGITAGRPMALYVGRAAHEKNIRFLLAATATARRSVPDALLVVAGEGPARAALAADARRAGLGEAVRFVGYLERGRELPDCYAGADLFVFASRTETQGLVLLEALAQGVPVLALAEMGTRDLVGQGAGTVAGAPEATAFGRQMAELLAAPARLRELGQAGRSTARRHSADAMATAVLDVYRVAVAGAPLPARQPALS